MTNETFSLLIATGWSVARDYAWIYCQRCWLISENIGIIFFEKIDMWLCSGAFCNLVLFLYM